MRLCEGANLRVSGDKKTSQKLISRVVFLPICTTISADFPHRYAAVFTKCALVEQISPVVGRQRLGDIFALGFHLQRLPLQGCLS
jgi:hypothetical protein